MADHDRLRDLHSTNAKHERLRVLWHRSRNARKCSSCGSRFRLWEHNDTADGEMWIRIVCASCGGRRFDQMSDAERRDIEDTQAYLALGPCAISDDMPMANPDPPPADEHGYGAKEEFARRVEVRVAQPPKSGYPCNCGAMLSEDDEERGWCEVCGS